MCFEDFSRRVPPKRCVDEVAVGKSLRTKLNRGPSPTDWADAAVGPAATRAATVHTERHTVRRDIGMAPRETCRYVRGKALGVGRGSRLPEPPLRYRYAYRD